jgi:hypothetical protein
VLEAYSFGNEELWFCASMLVANLVALHLVALLLLIATQPRYMPLGQPPAKAKGDAGQTRADARLSA